ncbi:MAG TPA: RIP metalloprotease RseP [Thermoanaerobaculia bacterium]|nr:RIP metalloprotease RseP [Thermoanaerobaculia bacterium]
MASIVASNLTGFVIVLGLLIFVHEAGHFLVAKLFRVRVLVFSFGFGKRLLGFKKGDTDYRVSLIPLGGYVRMAGDVPEENRPADPSEFLSKPKWQRFLILLAGPFMNVLVALAFFTLLAMTGTHTSEVPAILGEVVAGKPADRAGLRVGDRITLLDDEKIEAFDDLRLTISMHAGSPIRVQYVRDGKTLTTFLTPAREQSEYGSVGKAGIAPFIEPVVGRVHPGTAAARAGLHAGDRIVEINGKATTQLFDLSKVIEKSKGTEAVNIVVARGATRVAMTLPRSLGTNDEDYPGFSLPTKFRQLDFVPAVRDSFDQSAKMLKYTFITLGRLLRAEGSMKELSGPISIARISGEMLRRGWMEMVALMAAISLQLGVMNLLPIPVLDGGHIMVLLVEGAARRELSLKVKERIQQVGFAVLAALMIVVIYNDVITNFLTAHKG